MQKISVHLSSVIYLQNQSNLRDRSSKFLMMIYQLLCRPENPFFLKLQHGGLKRVVMRFGVRMGCFNSAKICRLVGTYTQSKLTNNINKEGI